MRSKSPELMNQICKYAEQYYFQNGHSPSTTKIAEAVGISRGTTYKYLVEILCNYSLFYKKLRTQEHNPNTRGFANANLIAMVNIGCC